MGEGRKEREWGQGCKTGRVLALTAQTSSREWELLYNGQVARLHNTRWKGKKKMKKKKKPAAAAWQHMIGLPTPPPTPRGRDLFTSVRSAASPFFSLSFLWELHCRSCGSFLLKHFYGHFQLMKSQFFFCFFLVYLFSRSTRFLC